VRKGQKFRTTNTRKKNLGLPRRVGVRSAPSLPFELEQVIRRGVVS
jgi:hypothetical protein